jgi:DNA-binding transcriptional LysR family regulator
MISNDMEMLRKMTIEGFGIGAVPQILISEDIREGRLVTVLPDTPFVERTFYLVYPSRREPPSKVIAFTEFIFSSCQPIPPWETLTDVFKTNPHIDSTKKSTQNLASAGS